MFNKCLAAGHHALGMADPAHDGFIPNPEHHRVDSGKIEVMPPLHLAVVVDEAAAGLNFKGQELAEVTFCNQPLNRPVEGQRERGRDDLRDQIGTHSGGFEHGASFLRVESHAGFGQHMFTLRESGEGNRGVKIRPGADDNGIDLGVLDGFLPMRVSAGNAEFLSGTLRGFRRTIHDPDDLDPVNRLQLRYMHFAGVAAGTDDGDSDDVLHGGIVGSHSQDVKWGGKRKRKLKRRGIAFCTWIGLDEGMNRLFLPVVIFWLVAILCQAAPSPPPPIAPRSAQAGARVQAEPVVASASELGVQGDVRFRPRLSDDVEGPKQVEVLDYSGTIVTQAEINEEGKFSLELPSAGLFELRLAPSSADDGWRARRAAYLFRGDWDKALQEMREMTAPALEACEAALADADEAERPALERRAALLRFADYWLSHVPETMTQRDIPEFVYLVKMLPPTAAGEDYMLTSGLGSHLAMIEVDEGPEKWPFVRFWIHLPSGYTGQEAWPLTVNLHGSTGGKKHMLEPYRGPIAAFPNGEGMPCIAISPKSEIGQHKVALTDAAIEWVKESFAIDETRLSITGHSMGGGGIADWLEAYPEKAAVLVPMASGAPQPPEGDTVKPPDVWVIFGEHDVSPEKLEKHRGLLKAFEAAGSATALSIQEQGNHMSVLEAFDEPAFWEWILTRKR